MNLPSKKPDSARTAACDMPWSSMEGNQVVRFCPDCTAHVFDFSTLPADQHLNAVQEVCPEELICTDAGQLKQAMFQRADGRYMTKQGRCSNTPGWTKQVWNLALLASQGMLMFGKCPNGDRILCCVIALAIVIELLHVLRYLRERSAGYGQPVMGLSSLVVVAFVWLLPIYPVSRSWLITAFGAEIVIVASLRTWLNLQIKKASKGLIVAREQQR